MEPTSNELLKLILLAVQLFAAKVLLNVLFSEALVHSVVDFLIHMRSIIKE